MSQVWEILFPCYLHVISDLHIQLGGDISPSWWVLGSLCFLVSSIFLCQHKIVASHSSENIASDVVVAISVFVHCCVDHVGGKRETFEQFQILNDTFLGCKLRFLGLFEFPHVDSRFAIVKCTYVDVPLISKL